MSATYYYTLRPPMYGTEPSGYVRREEYVEENRWRNHCGQVHPFHGEVEYPQALTHEQAWKYDLLAADERQAAEYWAWLECDHDLVEGRRMLQEYAGNGLDWLLRNADEGSGWCILALCWMGRSDLISRRPGGNGRGE